MPDARSLSEQLAAAANARDVDGALALFTDDARVVLPGSPPAGTDVVPAWILGHGDTGETRTTVLPLAIEALDDHTTVTRLRLRCEETDTGDVRWELEVGGLIAERDGRIARFEAHPSAEEARAAASGGSGR